MTEDLRCQGELGFYSTDIGELVEAHADKTLEMKTKSDDSSGSSA